MLVCRAGGDVVGFVTVKIHNEFTAEIHAMGVLPNWHRRGIGARLVRRVECYAGEEGVRFLTVKTLSPSKLDDNYRSTRRFYRAVGFVPVQEFPDLWGPDNPCLLMMKCLGD